MTLICPLNFIKGQILLGKLKGHYVPYCMYVILTLIAIYEIQHIESSVTGIRHLKVIKGKKVLW